MSCKTIALHHRHARSAAYMQLEFVHMDGTDIKIERQTAGIG